MRLYEHFIRHLLFRLEAERAHRLATELLAWLVALPGGSRILKRLLGVVQDQRLSVQAAGLTFPNPLGLAAGLDKDGRALAGWFALGFGSVEVGTITPLPQAGNPQPRMWRFPSEEALVNALGFPSAGAARVRSRLVRRWFPGPIGINLGKNARTPVESAANDYCATLAALWDVADYVVLNVSSPNTPGLRRLQETRRLAELLASVQRLNCELARLAGMSPRPLLVKVSLDLEPASLPDLIEIVRSCGGVGLVLGNTSTDPGLRPRGAEGLPGGVSGRPLRSSALRLLDKARAVAGDDFVLVSVGGVLTPEDVIERLRLGATLVQLCTGLVYRGPGFPAVALRALLREIEQRGVSSVPQLAMEG